MKEMKVQCPSICKIGDNLVFCTRREGRGHKGDHRGIRAQWSQKGKRVPITMELSA